MPMGTQLGTQRCLFRPITPGSMPRNIQESVVAKPLSGAPLPKLQGPRTVVQVTVFQTINVLEQELVFPWCG